MAVRLHAGSKISKGRLWARALNRSAIGALVAGVVLSRDLFRGLLGVGSLLLVEVILPRLTEGFPMNIQNSTDIDTPSCAHDRGYDGAQSGTGISGRSLAGLQAVCGLVGAVSGDGDAG